jgi:hypothetical protein
MVKAITVRIEIEVHIGADEVDAEDLERWIYDPSEIVGTHASRAADGILWQHGQQ